MESSKNNIAILSPSLRMRKYYRSLNQSEILAESRALISNLQFLSPNDELLKNGLELLEEMQKRIKVVTQRD